MTTLTPTDVAEDLRLSRYTVMERLRDRTIPGFRVGKEWRIDRGVYEEWKRTSHLPDDPNRIEPRSPRSRAAMKRT